MSRHVLPEISHPQQSSPVNRNSAGRRQLETRRGHRSRMDADAMAPHGSAPTSPGPRRIRRAAERSRGVGQVSNLDLESIDLEVARPVSSPSSLGQAGSDGPSSQVPQRPNRQRQRRTAELLSICAAVAVGMITVPPRRPQMPWFQCRRRMSRSYREWLLHLK